MVSYRYALLLLCAYSRHVRLCVIALATGNFHLFLVCLGGDRKQLAHHAAHISLLQVLLQIAVGNVINSTTIFFETLTGADNLRDLSMDGVYTMYSSEHWDRSGWSCRMYRVPVYTTYTVFIYLCNRLNPGGHYMYRTVVTICTASLTFSNSTFCPHSCIYVFCVDLRTNSDYFPIQHWLTGFYNWDGVCLLRGTDWIFI